MSKRVLTTSMLGLATGNLPAGSVWDCPDDVYQHLKEEGHVVDHEDPPATGDDGTKVDPPATDDGIESVV